MTKLFSTVYDYLEMRSKESNITIKEAAEQITTYGRHSGLVEELIYTKQCVAFFRKHKKDIAEIVLEHQKEYGYAFLQSIQGWEKEDVFIESDINKTVLAWFAFEETCRQIKEVL